MREWIHFRQSFRKSDKIQEKKSILKIPPYVHALKLASLLLLLVGQMVGGDGWPDGWWREGKLKQEARQQLAQTKHNKLE